MNTIFVNWCISKWNKKYLISNTTYTKNVDYYTSIFIQYVYILKTQKKPV